MLRMIATQTLRTVKNVPPSPIGKAHRPSGAERGLASRRRSLFREARRCRAARRRPFRERGWTAAASARCGHRPTSARAAAAPQRWTASPRPRPASHVCALPATPAATPAPPPPARAAAPTASPSSARCRSTTDLPRPPRRRSLRHSTRPRAGWRRNQERRRRLRQARWREKWRSLRPPQSPPPQRLAEPRQPLRGHPPA